MRAKAPGCEGGVTMRQLESLIRLAEARARCDLRSTVTEVRRASSVAMQYSNPMHCLRTAAISLKQDIALGAPQRILTHARCAHGHIFRIVKTTSWSIL